MTVWRIIEPDITQLALCKVGANKQRVFLLKSDDGGEQHVAALAPIYKAEGQDWRTAYVPVAVPGVEENQGIFGTSDGDQDVWETDDIRSAAHSFMRNGGKVVAKHFDADHAPGVKVAESAVALADFEVEGPDGTKHTIKEGTWYVGLNMDDRARELVKQGEIDAVSVEGLAKRIAKDAALVPNKPGVTNWVERTGGLPKKIADLAGDLITEQGFTTSHAIATAVNQARKFCAKGKGEWCAAVAEWEAKKAAAHVAKDQELAVLLAADPDTLDGVEQPPEGFWKRVAKALGFDFEVGECGCGCGSVFEATDDGDADELIAKAQLSTAARKKLPKSAFVYPEKAPGPGSYPIHDRAHAANALSRGSGDAKVRAAVCKRHPDLPACRKMAKDGSLPADSGTVEDVELNERVEKLEGQVDGLAKQLIGTDEEPGMVAKIAKSVETLAERIPEKPKGDAGDAGKDAGKDAGSDNGNDADTIAKVNKEIEAVAEKFAGAIEPLAKRLEALETGDSEQQETNGKPVAKTGTPSPMAGIIFD